jgi:hypothetical protein
VACRLDPALIDRVEERAAELAHRVGFPVTMTDMMRVGLELALKQPLPPEPIRSPCSLVRGADGTRCVTCMRALPQTCPRTGAEPGATHR